jgi:hypothetical protein
VFDAPNARSKTPRLGGPRLEVPTVGNDNFPLRLTSELKAR